jgi:hypothetical protein
LGWRKVPGTFQYSVQPVHHQTVWREDPRNSSGRYVPADATASRFYDKTLHEWMLTERPGPIPLPPQPRALGDSRSPWSNVPYPELS